MRSSKIAVFALVAALGDVDLFRAGDLLVARHALQGVTKRARVERRDRNRIVALDAFLSANLQAERRILARGLDASEERE